MTRYQLTSRPTEAVGERGPQVHLESLEQPSGQYSRRNTEPDTVHRQPRGEEQSYLGSRPHHPPRAATYSEWNDQHRKAAAQNPMVEYICAEPTPLSKDACPDSSSRHHYAINQTSNDRDEDEETPLTIPSSYHYGSDEDYTQACKPVNRYRNDPVRQSSNTLPQTKTHSTLPISKSHQNEVVNKVADYVLARSGMHGRLNDHSKHLIEDLATEIIHALKTGSWDHLPQILVQDVKQMLT